MTVLLISRGYFPLPNVPLIINDMCSLLPFFSATGILGAGLMSRRSLEGLTDVLSI